MSLLRFIVQGIGWELGRSAAREGIERLTEDEPPKTEAEIRAAEKAAKRAAREAERAEKARAKQKKRDAKQIEDELRALKRRLGE